MNIVNVLCRVWPKPVLLKELDEDVLNLGLQVWNPRVREGRRDSVLSTGCIVQGFIQDLLGGGGEVDPCLSMHLFHTHNSSLEGATELKFASFCSS